MADITDFTSYLTALIETQTYMGGISTEEHDYMVKILDHLDELTGIENITIESGVTNIGDSIFVYMPINKVTIANTVTSIGDCAFSGCELLTDVTIPNSVTVIETEAFAYCESLTSITIPSSVVTVGSPFIFNYVSTTIRVSWNEGYKPSGWAENWYSTGGESTIIYGYTGT